MGIKIECLGGKEKYCPSCFATLDAEGLLGSDTVRGGRGRSRCDSLICLTCGAVSCDRCAVARLYSRGGSVVEIDASGNGKKWFSSNGKKVAVGNGNNGSLKKSNLTAKQNLNE